MIRPALLCAFLLFLPVLAHAQTEERPNVQVYRPAFFQANQPTTALDMVHLLPGFQLDGGNSGLRGFSGSVGNVLIDGKAPTSKQESVDDILRRIPVHAVDRIELIRAGAAGVDMYGHTLLANVIRNRTTTLRGRAEVEYAANTIGLSAPSMAVNVTHQGDTDTLDLSFSYGRDINGNHGRGLRNRFDALGLPVRLADYYEPELQIFSQGNAQYRTQLFGGDLNLSGVIRQEVEYADIVETITFPSPVTHLGTERDRERSVEGQLQYEYPFSAATRGRLYFIHRSNEEKGLSRSVNPTGTDISQSREGTRETVLRLDGRTEEGPLALEAGAEGAINILRSRNLLELNGVSVTLPGSHVRVEEQRAEFFAIATWRIDPDLTLEAAARQEISTISQSGETTLSRSLAFFKPRGLLSWRFAPDHELRFLAEREVGQLDFGGFVSSANLINNNVSAGNQNLTPPRTTRLELAWEHRFWERGAITLKARREFIAGLLDSMPVTVNGRTFNTRGNVGNGRRDALEVSLILPLDGLGLTGFTVQADGELRDTRMRDPLTGDLREFSGSQPHWGEIGLTHDLPAWNLRWGVEYDLPGYSTDYRIDEVSLNREPSSLEAFAEYKPLPGWTVRVFGRDLAKIPYRRERLVYTGLRDRAPLNFRELRRLNNGAIFGVNIQHSF